MREIVLQKPLGWEVIGFPLLEYKPDQSYEPFAITSTSEGVTIWCRKWQVEFTKAELER